MSQENLNVVKKYFTSPFVLDKVKLTRILNIIEDRFKEANIPFRYNFEVFHQNGKTVNLSSIDGLFSLDNTVKNPISQLKFETLKSEGLSDSNSNKIECVLSFENEGNRNILLSVSTENSPKLANQIFAEIEEQIERTFLNNWVYKYIKPGYLINNNSAKLQNLSLLIPIFGAVLGGLIAFVFSELPTAKTNNKAAYLEKAQQAVSIDEKINILLELQMEQLKKDITPQTNSEQFNLTRLKSLINFRTLFIALPLLIIIGCIFYVINWCYPVGVFLWGDFEQHYNSLMANKKFIWTVVIISTVLGVIGNLFVNALSGYVRFDS